MADRISDLANFHSLFHYYGIVSMQERRRGQTVFKIPNVCVRRQLFDYLRDAYRRTRTPDWMAWSRLAGAFAYDGDWAPFLKRLALDYAERAVPSLARGTTLHQVVYVFRGADLHTLDEIVCEQMP